MSTVRGYILQKECLGCEPSYTPENTNFVDAKYKKTVLKPRSLVSSSVEYIASTDQASSANGGNVRPLVQNLINEGTGRGGYLTNPRSDGANIQCPLGQKNFFAMTDNYGYICTSFDSNACPTIGGQRPVESGWRVKEEVDKNNLAISCEYDRSAFTTQGVRDWLNWFANTNNEFYEENMTSLYSNVLPTYCAQESTHCPTETISKKKLETCSRFIATGDPTAGTCEPDEFSMDNKACDDGGFICRQWALAVPSSGGVPADLNVVDATMIGFCNARLSKDDYNIPQFPEECQCIFRNYDSYYNAIKPYAPPSSEGCWWHTCGSSHTQLVPPSLYCTLDEVTICQQVIVIEDNEGWISPEWGGDINCGNDGGSNPGAPPPAEWQWWIWLIIAIVSVIGIAIVFFVLRALTKDSEPIQIVYEDMYATTNTY